MSSNNSSKKVFGQSMSRRKPPSSSRYRQQMGQNGKTKSLQANPGEADDEQLRLAQAAAQRRDQRRKEGEEIDKVFGYERFDGKGGRRGWIFNILPTTVASSSSIDDDNGASSSSSGPERSGLDLYFLTQENDTFKCTILYRPYFYVLPETQIIEVESLISALYRLYEPQLVHVEAIRREDLDEVNHLGHGKTGRMMLKLSFDNVQALVDVRDRIRGEVDRNLTRMGRGDDDASAQQHATFTTSFSSTDNNHTNPLSSLTSIREHDVPYHVRAAIDLGVRCGAWYTVNHDPTSMIRLSDQDVTKKADPTFLAFDIECTKAPLKFPDANVDSIFMISYMVGGIGYLIISRHVVGSDVEDFEYTPKPVYPGPFHIFNEVNEEDLIRRFLDEFKRLKPQIVVTYNGDFFDWPFLEARAAMYGLDIRKEMGIECVGDEYRGRCCVHLDAFHWVKRDSYLPQGSQGLKAVTKYKLGYDPVEVDPEDMVRFARERPVHMATYSVSDAVATYYLYLKYVHLFIFSLCTIIPMGPEDVLRKGSGTLCETLLMVEAYLKKIICPNKQLDPLVKFHNGHLLESETYIGGKVECLETGVYRSDVEYDFDLKPSAFQQLIDNIDRDLTFAIEVEEGLQRSQIANYDEIRCEIIEQLELLRDRPIRKEKPYIYHLDVGAMYPNIILTNRLQPSAIVNDTICAACDFNQESSNCKRKMDWVWRGDYAPASKTDYLRQKEQLMRETVDGESFRDLNKKTQALLIAKRVKQYSKNAYNKTKITSEEPRKDTVCMRENDFYVETVRQFRDRRYEYKKKTKEWKKKKVAAEKANDAVKRKEAEDAELVFDSLQVAHKCILNSFYGYVMRKGARWRSMEMAGIVTKTGADLITQARKLVEQIGRPLELDTDGIWCILPGSFPDAYDFVTHDGRKMKLEYPCLMLNADVHDNFTNHQYQTLKDADKRVYETRSECSIFFEVDGPYRCMVLPASTEEGKLLKKRYAVFNFDGSLAELKGFELKRRGELELIKTFQSQVFSRFLDGDSLKDCYDSVADVANHWLDVIDTQGECLETDELVDLISENRSMSRQLEDYGDQKGTSQTTARRLGEFLGAEIIKDKGLNCKFIIADRPHGAPVTERAIPTAIWKAEPPVMKHYLKKWLKSPGLTEDDFDIRNILDWEYYRDRLGKTIQKIITIPAALQKIDNPVPRVRHPDWLEKTVRRLNDRFQQKSIKDMFSSTKVLKGNKEKNTKPQDIEDLFNTTNEVPKRPVIHARKKPAPTKVATTVVTPSLPPHTPLTNPMSKSSFELWLARKKQLWRSKRQIRKKRIRTSASTIESTSRNKKQRQNPPQSLEGFLRDKQSNISQQNWHVVEIRHIFEGEFVLWVMFDDGSLQKINLTIPRKFYVDFRKDVSLSELSSKNVDWKKVEKHLPRGKPSHHLYEVTMSEHDFRKNDWEESLLKKLSTEEGDEMIEYYEKNTPLSFHALIELGCVSKVNNSNETKKSFVLSDLSRVDKKKDVYLHETISYRRIFLYESIHLTNKTGLIALFVMTSETSVEDKTRHSQKVDAECYFWIVKPGSSRKRQKPLTGKQCEDIVSNLLEEITNADPDSPYSPLSPASKIAIKDIHFEEITAPFKSVDKTITTILQNSKRPTFLVANTTKPPLLLRSLLPSSTSQLPLITLPFPSGTLPTLPALGWEPLSVQLSLEAFFHATVVTYPQRVARARFANVPIGNLTGDDHIVLYDVFFARRLRKSRCLIWASEDDQPDIGNNDDWEEGEEETISPLISEKGAWRNVCVEIDLQHLAISAIMDPSYVTINTTRVGGATPEDRLFEDAAPTAMSLGDDMSCSLSLQLLRSLVHGWMDEAREKESLAADDLLHDFYRLVCSRETMMHDPVLYRFLHKLMTSTFYRLLGELQRLGAKIIRASFHRVVLATNKKKVSEASEYVRFIIATIMRGNADGLGRIAMHTSQYWCHYLFLDEYNFGGILFENREVDPENDDPDMPAITIADADGGERQTLAPTVISGWNIIHYLAGELQPEYFRAIIGRFSKDVYKKELQIRAKIKNHGLTSAVEESSNDKDKIVSPEEQLLQYKKKLMSKQFASYLTRALGEIIKNQNDDVFPQLPGSHLPLKNPALEFVKNVMVVLQLDKDIEHETTILKKSLLTQLDVKEYSDDSVWKNPCATFVLPDLYCMECKDVRDVNLCILPPDYDENQKSPWQCEDCSAPYNTELIEWRLVDMIQRKSCRYQLQDLRCVKTQRVAVRALAGQSQCSAEYKLDITREDIRKELSVLKKMADFYNLEWLLETVVGLLTNFSAA